jgi:hypothetical protein
MKERRYLPDKALSVDEALPGLQKAISQLGGRSWAKLGSGVIVHTDFGDIWLNKDELDRIEIHNGSDDEIGDILDRIRQSQTHPRPRHSSVRKSSGGKRYPRK